MAFSLLSLASVLLCAACASKPVESPKFPASWTEAIEPFAIGDNLYWVGSAELSSLLITSEAGHILIDVPMESGANLVERNIRRLGFEPKDVKIILTSQAHFDHVAGIAKFKKKTKAKLWVSAADAETMHVASNDSPDWAIRFPAAKVDAFVEHLQTVRVGQQTVRAHLTPGHTRGCTSWSGELVINGRAESWMLVCSLSVLPDYQIVGPAQSYPDIGRDYCRSWQHLAEQKPSVFLATHGSFMGLESKRARLAAGDSQAFIDPTGYQAYLLKAGLLIEKALDGQGHGGGCATLLEPSANY